MTYDAHFKRMESGGQKANKKLELLKTEKIVTVFVYKFSILCLPT